MKPKSLIEVEEKLEAQQLMEETKMMSTTTNGGYTSKMQATLNNNPATLKEHEVAIFNKKYETQQNISTVKGQQSVPQSFI